MTFISIFYIAYKEQDISKKSLLQVCMWALFIYLVFATTVHPWYLCALVAFSVFTPYRFPIVWSAVVILSYYTYITPHYAENMWLVSLEYLIVYAYLAYELWKNDCLRKDIKANNKIVKSPVSKKMLV